MVQDGRGSGVWNRTYRQSARGTSLMDLMWSSSAQTPGLGSFIWLRQQFVGCGPASARASSHREFSRTSSCPYALCFCRPLVSGWASEFTDYRDRQTKP